MLMRKPKKVVILNEPEDLERRKLYKLRCARSLKIGDSVRRTSERRSVLSK